MKYLPGEKETASLAGSEGSLTVAVATADLMVPSSLKKEEGKQKITAVIFTSVRSLHLVPLHSVYA